VAESRAVVAVLLERDAEIAAAEQQAEPSDVDTDDEAHEAPEYDAWQARELSRVSRDRAEREAAFKEREELERLRAMTDEEREEWDRAHPPPVSAAQAARDSAKWAFMQKYYHKGAFFQTGADDKFGTIGTFDIYTRDFGAATGEDKGVDRSMLPKARGAGLCVCCCVLLLRCVRACCMWRLRVCMCADEVCCVRRRCKSRRGFLGARARSSGRTWRRRTRHASGTTPGAKTRACATNVRAGARIHAHPCLHLWLLGHATSCMRACCV
jgi:hypothetical protein